MEFMDLNTKAGFLGGTLCSVICNISFDDILFTVIMASIGASVSYVVSKFLNFVFRYFRNDKSCPHPELRKGNSDLPRGRGEKEVSK